MGEKEGEGEAVEDVYYKFISVLDGRWSRRKLTL